MDIRNSVWGEYIAEAVGTMVLIIIGDGASAMSTLYDAYGGSYWGVCIVWGLAVTMAVYITGAISGAHINPAVTLGFALYGGFPWKKVPGYMISQVVGAFVGAALVYVLYYPVINAFHAAHDTTRSGPGGADTAAAFFTFPSEHITTGHAFVDEIILTGVLVMGILAIVDTYNGNRPGANSHPLMIGLLVAAVGGFGGMLEGFAINPARDFGPRVFGWFAGWGQNAFPGPDNFWWVPIAACLLGGIAAGLVYNFMVRPFMPDHPKRKKAYGPSPAPKNVV